MTYRVIVFDWDGTLYDSASYIVSCVQAACASVDIDIPAQERVRQFIGLSLDEALMRCMPALLTEKFAKLKATYKALSEHSDFQKPSLFPGTKNVLFQLNRDGYSLAIATGKSRKGLNRDLRNFTLEKHFITSRCADETTSKPHPQMLMEIIDELHVAPKDVLMVGDTSHDIELALNAGVDVLAVSYGAHAKEVLTQYELKGCLDDVRLLPRWLRTSTT